MVCLGKRSMTGLGWTGEPRAAWMRANSAAHLAVVDHFKSQRMVKKEKDGELGAKSFLKSDSTWIAPGSDYRNGITLVYIDGKRLYMVLILLGPSQLTTIDHLHLPALSVATRHM
jgi:hypothetical protein